MALMFPIVLFLFAITFVPHHGSGDGAIIERRLVRIVKNAHGRVLHGVAATPTLSKPWLESSVP